MLCKPHLSGLAKLASSAGGVIHGLSVVFRAPLSTVAYSTRNEFIKTALSGNVVTPTLCCPAGTCADEVTMTHPSTHRVTLGYK